MATSQTSTVTKIYDLQIVGFTDIDKQLKALAKDFELVKKAKEDLAKASGSTSTTSKELDDINKRLADQAVRQKELTLAVKEQTEARLRLKLAAEQEKTQTAGSAKQIADDNSIKKAREDNKALRAERDLLNTSTEQGKTQIAALNTEIDKNNELIKENVDLLTKQKINVGNYEGSAKLVVEALKRIEAEIASVSQKQQGLRDLQARDPIGFKLAGGEENLNKTTTALAGLTKQADALGRVTNNPQFLNIAGRVADSTGEVKFFTKALVDLENSGQKNTDVYTELRARLAQLQDTIRDTKDDVRALSSDTRQFDLIAGGFKAMADGAQLFVGAQALFGKSNADVQKSIQTLLAVQNIATAARSIADEATKRGTALNKAYNFVLIQTRILTDANAASSAKWMAALKLGIIGAIITAVGLLIANLDKLNGKQKELDRGLEGLQDTTDVTKEKLKSYGKSIDEVVDGSINDLEEAIKGVNTELGKTPSAVDTAQASLKLLNNRVDELTDDLLTNTFTFTKLLQGIGGEGASFATLKGLEDAGDKIDVINEKLKKLNQLQQQKDLNNGILANFQSIIRTSDLQIDANNRLLANDKTTLGQRIDLLKSNLSERKKIIDANRQTEILNAGKDAQKLKDAAAKANVETIKAERDFQDQILATQKQGGEKAIADQLAKIDALRDTLLSKEKTRTTELQKDHDLSFTEEVAFLNNVEDIETAALNAKIRLFQAQKNLNAQELKQLAEFQQSKAELELKTAQDIQKIRNDEFKKQADLLKQQFETDKANIEGRVSQAQAAPQATETDRATAKAQGDQEILDLQAKLNKDLDILQKQLNPQSVANVKIGAKEIQDQQQKILDDQKQITAAIFSDIANTGAIDIAKINDNYAKLRGAILSNDKLTVTQRQLALDKLDKLQQKDLLSGEVIRLTDEFNEIKKLFLRGLVDEKAFIEAKQKLDEAKANSDAALLDSFKQRLTAPSASNTQSIATSQLSKAFGFAEGSEENQLLGNVLSQSFQVATEAMNAYFDAEQTRIQQSLDLNIQRIELEKEQATARAQSQAEVDSINKQAAAKEATLRRQAGEQLKKARLSEAKISLATELANIAVAAASNPLNGVTFGAAGAIMCGILAALAIARYAVNISNISRQQFGRGGRPGEDVPTRGGKFGGKSHPQGGTDFYFKGRGYNAEVEELAIIRTRNAPKGKTFTVTGTQEQIASAINKVGGGDDFAPGAKITEKKRSVISRIFARGGNLTEVKDTSPIRELYEEQRSTSIIKSKSITDIFSKDKRDHYTRVVDQVIRENRELVERQDRKSILSFAINKIFTSREEISTERIESLSKIVNDRLDQERNKIYTVTGSTKQIVTRLDRYAKETLAFGGNPREVPLKGGKFGGRSHSQGGTDFQFQGRTYNAEVDELAIIRTKGAPKNKRFTLTGTTLEIASAINQLGGGKSFAPGARIEKFQTGGVLGAVLEAPVFASGGGSSDALLSEVKKLNSQIAQQAAATNSLAEETSKRIDRITAIVVAQDVTSQQKKDIKKTQVGSLPA